MADRTFGEEREKNREREKRGGKPGKKKEKVPLMKGSGVAPPIPDQACSLTARPWGSVGSGSLGAWTIH